MNLYNKYRPKDFSTVFGQKNVVQILKNTIKNDKIAHAYIFTGPRGTGKTTLARILSKAINCLSENKKPCLDCANCLSFTQGNFLDIIEIDGASNRKIEDVRDLIDKAKYLPQQGKKKIYIIDEVHALTKDAFNALLKIIEEPPAHIVFILATTDVHKVLPTILSRCQRFDFKLISPDDLSQKLAYILEQEKVEFEKEALIKIAQLAQGGARNAEVILQQLLTWLTEKLTVEKVEHFFGLGNDGKIDLFLNNLKEKNQSKTLEIIQSVFVSGENLDSFYNFILEKLRDNLLNPDENFFFNQEEVLNIIKILAKNHREVFSTHFPSLFLEISAIEIIDFLSGKKTFTQVVEKTPPLLKTSTSQNISSSFPSYSSKNNNFSSNSIPQIKKKEPKKNPILENLIKENLKMELTDFREKWLNIIQILPFRLKNTVKTGKLVTIKNQKELFFDYALGLKETVSNQENIKLINEKLLEFFGENLFFKPFFSEEKPLENLSADDNDNNKIKKLTEKYTKHIEKNEPVRSNNLNNNEQFITSVQEVADILGGEIIKEKK